jgi:predicted transcriptional regulator YdeE
VNIVQFKELTISGISTRTKKDDEMNPATSKIARLYQKFDDTVTVNYQEGTRVYGVYYNYEADASGEFSVLAGSDKAESAKETLESVTLPTGKYMVFQGKGGMPQVVIDTWGKIWNYFSNDNAPHKRAYTTDFEYYKSPEEVEIYIAIR